jgi:hypothetical protein
MKDGSPARSFEHGMGRHEKYNAVKFQGKKAWTLTFADLQAVCLGSGPYSMRRLLPLFGASYITLCARSC